MTAFGLKAVERSHREIISSETDKKEGGHGWKRPICRFQEGMVGKALPFWRSAAMQ